MKIGIIDYKMGNIASLRNSLEKIGADAEIITDAEMIAGYGKVILPGVGAFHDAAEHLKMMGMDEALASYVKSGNYLFGVCLGMQLLFEKSEESHGATGLSLIPGDVVHFRNSDANLHLKIPHMGWNRMEVVKDDPIFEGLEEAFYLYFVHSYHVRCNAQYVLGETEYGERFVSAVRHGNIYGLQPHPEKSHDRGLKILKNFVELR
jgi:glutamine amidotransferase